MKRIRIRIGTTEIKAELNETRTANAIWRMLPIKARINLWGEEIYFAIPLSLAQEAGQAVVHKGDLGYWPPGNAICIFCGPTPISTGNEIRPASAVTVFGRIIEDAMRLKEEATEGMEIVIREEDDG
jgi:hypothetical protein